ncbi:MAG TPA: hypothetical protein VI320_06550, partial [Terracidiphilus sp.]
YNNHRVIFADGVRSFMQKVQTNVGYAGENALDLGFRLLPVLAVLLLATESLLRLAQPVFVLLEAVKRLDEFAIGQCGKANYAHVDAHGRGRRMNWLLYLTLGKDRDEPFASYLPDCDTPRLTKDLPAVAIADPTEFRKENPAVFLIEFKSLREAKAIVLPLLLEPRRSYDLNWMDLAGLQLLERFKVSFPRIFEILQ